jgi:hypothetical protein
MQGVLPELASELGGLVGAGLAGPGRVDDDAQAWGTAYVAMLTTFYVDNGPRLPLWDRLPVITF